MDNCRDERNGVLLENGVSTHLEVIQWLFFCQPTNYLKMANLLKLFCPVYILLVACNRILYTVLQSFCHIICSLFLLPQHTFRHFDYAFDGKSNKFSDQFKQITSLFSELLRKSYLFYNFISFLLFMFQFVATVSCG